MLLKQPGFTLIAVLTPAIGANTAIFLVLKDVLKLIIAQSMQPALIGIGVGLMAASAMTRLMRRLLFGVSATDPATFALIGALLTFVALPAALVQAPRAIKVDPMIALRSE